MNALRAGDYGRDGLKLLRSSLLFLLFSLFSFALQASQLSAIERNNEGVELLKQEQVSEAYTKFVESLAEEPFSSEVKINLGLAFELNEEKEKALSEYASVLKNSKRPEVRYFALFNTARILGEEKKYNEALNFYQAALEIVPNSREVKTNIELLHQQQQQQGGGGKNDQDDKNKNKDKKDKGEGEDEQDKNQDSPRVNRRKQKPKPFKSQELTKKDVEKILEELKNQEQKVRAKQNKKNTKEQPREKDW